MKRLNRPFRVNEASVRGVAILVFILSSISLLLGNIIIPAFLAIDFAIRALLTPRLSPLAFLSERIVSPLFRFRKKMIRFKPKRFAALIGFILALASIGLILAGRQDLSIVPLIFLTFFSFLEAAFRFCAGCRIFGLLIKLGLVEEEECPDCVYIDGGGI